jgi:hypothetical protein
VTWAKAVELAPGSCWSATASLDSRTWSLRVTAYCRSLFRATKRPSGIIGARVEATRHRPDQVVSRVEPPAPERGLLQAQQPPTQAGVVRHGRHQGRRVDAVE